MSAKSKKTSTSCQEARTEVPPPSGGTVCLHCHSFGRARTSPSDGCGVFPVAFLYIIASVAIAFITMLYFTFGGVFALILTLFSWRWPSLTHMPRCARGALVDRRSGRRTR